ncbi:MAG: SDR family NAD(P)-dependent oxidoreductase [Bacteroidales bacterium]|jgi:short-subunit dehydrogenase|nr:SDR family NAD(P)-dependent oxidoreductase [Bacteroidales bacterium]MDD4043816.1 SDR family NAD(P)-dependent oxidoreductase [Bacteroidales bacterium]MDD4580778.1 SDR family NAD(P)-dependent oxidoreductase [Bacteroidales bacterium]MDX9889815.1 SDR family NAD(P)-dependent oxidoreductase [Bacteroidales bacterium]
MSNDFTLRYGSWAMVAGASEGLGAAFAEALAKRGLNLILLARRIEKLEDLASSLKEKYNIEIRFFSVDLHDFNQTKTLVSSLNVSIGLLVYNAAYAPIAYFSDINESQLTQIVDVNVKTPLLLVKLVSEEMIRSGKGGILLMSSLTGTQGSPKVATYAATKAFNAILAEGIWKELKPKGIDVIASCAGAIMTPGYANAQNGKAPGTLSPEKVAEISLKALGRGPIVIPGTINKLAHFFMGRLLSRKTAINIMELNTKNLS